MMGLKAARYFSLTSRLERGIIKPESESSNICKFWLYKAQLSKDAPRKLEKEVDKIAGLNEPNHKRQFLDGF